jgi:hypothetical protein
VKLSVLHDQDGKVLALSRSGPPAATGSGYAKVGILPRQGQMVTEVELGKDLEAVPLLELHKKCRVDAAKARLVPQEPPKRKRGASARAR